MNSYLSMNSCQQLGTVNNQSLSTLNGQKGFKKNDIFHDLSQIMRLFEERVKILIQQIKKKLNQQKLKTQMIQQNKQKQQAQMQQIVSKTIDSSQQKLNIKNISKKTSMNMVQALKDNNQASKINQEGQFYAKKYLRLYKNDHNYYLENIKIFRRFLARIKEKLQQYSQLCWNQRLNVHFIQNYFDKLAEYIQQLQHKDEGVDKLIFYVLCDYPPQKYHKKYIRRQSPQKQTIQNKYKNLCKKTESNTEYLQSTIYQSNQDSVRNTQNNFNKTATKYNKGFHSSQNSPQKSKYKSGNKYIFRNLNRSNLSEYQQKAYSCLNLDLNDFKRRRTLGLQDNERSSNQLKSECLNRNRIIMSMINRYAKDYTDYIAAKQQKYKKKKNKSLNDIRKPGLKDQKYIPTINKIIDMKNKTQQRQTKIKSLIEIQRNNGNKKVKLLEWQANQVPIDVDSEKLKEYAQQKNIQQLITMKKLDYKYQSHILKKVSSLHPSSLVRCIEEVQGQQDDQQQISKKTSNKQSVEKNNIKNNIILGQIRFQKKSCSASAAELHKKFSSEDNHKNKDILERCKSHIKKQQKSSRKNLSKFMNKIHNRQENNRPFKISKIQVCHSNQSISNNNYEQNSSNNGNNRTSQKRLKLEHSSFMKKKNKIKYRNQSIINKCKNQMKQELNEIRKQQGKPETQFGFFKRNQGIKYEIKSPQSQIKIGTFQGFFINGIKHSLLNQTIFKNNSK